MTNPIFFGDPEQVAAAVPGGVFSLTGPEARHAVSVKRLAPGEDVDIVDGAGLRIRGTVRSADPGLLEVDVRDIETEPETGQELILVQALAKGDRDEQAIEAATELGVDTVIPWQSERSIVRWRAEKAAKGRAKWQAVVTSAAKQSRRSRLPKVLDVADSKSLPAVLARVDLVLVLHEEADAPFAQAVDAVRREQAGSSENGSGDSYRDSSGDSEQRISIAVIVGPEGGISPAELDALRAAGATAVRLGPHVLRSSSAGPAALVLLNHLLGRWS
ncbi:16S rRNA (uracil(1498)-N(3))-methyltransferase [Arthrobacter sp. Sa2CUA1]|uniref:Ribosomal RNA small subunit methyltransferase E n=1 Tax=Arthrobacter gallicola TaxID=2762225 RepID=A0ABR8UNS8_9MICC|nr:16S rRNA (uracil(1498)-N(3))-methyltransferase [Arthrobacter gallicola]MBD7994194.1 16S rRNA (uracil(1498)-N(3))-methyltransferase [Arthrobacter gallicola]